MEIVLALIVVFALLAASRAPDRRSGYSAPAGTGARPPLPTTGSGVRKD